MIKPKLKVKKIYAVYKRNKSLRKTANIFKVSYNTIRILLIKNGLERFDDCRKAKLKQYERNNHIVTEDEIDEDFKTRIFK